MNVANSYLEAPNVFKSLGAWLAVSVLVWALLFYGSSVVAWVRYGAGRGVPFLALLRARTRGISPTAFAKGLRFVKEAGLGISARELEFLCLSGAKVMSALAAFAAARRAGLDFSFKKLLALVLERRDPLEHVQDLVRLRDKTIREMTEEVLAEELNGLLGAEGRVEFAVSPPGIVDINGVRVSAIAYNGHIDKGKWVRVVATRGNVAVVEQR